MPGAKSAVAGAVVMDKITDYKDASSYNNFYEFGTDKGDPVKNAHTLKTTPWTVEIEGLVKKPGKYGLEDLLKLSAQEERVYRLRCVEGWSMVVPWVGYSPVSYTHLDVYKRQALCFVPVAFRQSLSGNSYFWVGYAAVAALIAGGILLARERIAAKLPRLEILDDVMYKSIAVGFAFFTIATVLGALWAAEALSLIHI